MEQYFDENKSDLKYILEEKKRRENVEPTPIPSKNKLTDLYYRWKKWMCILLLCKSKKQKR